MRLGKLSLPFETFNAWITEVVMARFGYDMVGFFLLFAVLSSGTSVSMPVSESEGKGVLLVHSGYCQTHPIYEVCHQSPAENSALREVSYVITPYPMYVSKPSDDQNIPDTLDFKERIR